MQQGLHRVLLCLQEALVLLVLQKQLLLLVLLHPALLFFVEIVEQNHLEDLNFVQTVAALSKIN